MKFSTRADIEAPIEFVYATLSDFEAFERGALRRGAEVLRTDATRGFGPGMCWNVQFSYRGKARRIEITLAAAERPVLLRYSGVSPSVDGTLALELLALSPQRTRIKVDLEVKPRTIAARLFLQSLKLVKTRLVARFKKRVATYVTEIEGRYRST